MMTVCIAVFSVVRSYNIISVIRLQCEKQGNAESFYSTREIHGPRVPNCEVSSSWNGSIKFQKYRKQTNMIEQVKHAL